MQKSIAASKQADVDLDDGPKAKVTPPEATPGKRKTEVIIETPLPTKKKRPNSSAPAPPKVEEKKEGARKS